MGNPIQNLGDYNIVREALQAVGGNKEILYKSIGDTAVAKAAPKIFRKGTLIGSAITAGLIGASFLGYKGYAFLRDRRQKIENEPALKKEFAEAIETEASSPNIENSENCGEIG